MNITFSGGAPQASSNSTFGLLADANRDNQVSTADFNAVSQGFNHSNTGWSQGDFNGDGVTNALDFGALARNFGNAPAAAVNFATLVPEPAAFALLSPLMLLTRRRR